MAPINVTEALFDFTTESLENVTTQHTTVAKATPLVELICAYVLLLGIIAVFIIIMEELFFPQKQRTVHRANVQLIGKYFSSSLAFCQIVRKQESSFHQKKPTLQFNNNVYLFSATSNKICS